VTTGDYGAIDLWLAALGEGQISSLMFAEIAMLQAR
jgi:hypothetical protein